MGKGLGRRRLLIAAVALALVVVPAALILSQQRAASAATILSILDGSASVARGTAAFALAADGDIVSPGDRVQTAVLSHAMVTFFDGSTLEIEPATTVRIEEAEAVAGGAIAIRISQTLGRTWASVQKLTRADSKFEVRTPTLTAAVRGTGFITDVLADGTSTVQTADGSVSVTAQGQTVIVGAGQTTTAQPNGPPSVPLAIAPQNRLRFGMHSPAQLVVIDPLGRACGIVREGPSVVRQIPGCLASEPGVDPQLIDVPDAVAGRYQLFMESVAPGGAFVATASAVDGLGTLSFNYIASGSGQPGDKFGSSIDVSSGPRGVLSGSGLTPLTVVQRAPVKFVRGPSSPTSASGAPDPGSFPPLPGIGYAAGTNFPVAVPLVSPTPSPALTQSPQPTVTSPTPAPSAATAIPTAAPTAAPTFAPTPPPTAPPTPVPTVPPTPTPTPVPTPTPPPPTLSGGTAAPGATLPILGTNWLPGAAITISWPDGTQVASADVQPDGRFATLVRIPQNATPGGTYRITATGGGRTATADVVIAFSPTLTILATFPPRAGTSVPYSGAGWPANSSYSLLFDGRAIGGGTTSAAGALLGPTGGNPTFIVPPNTTPGAHTVTVTSGNASATASLTTQ